MHASPAETNHIITTNSRHQMAGEVPPATEEKRGKSRLLECYNVFLNCRHGELSFTVLRDFLTYELLLGSMLLVQRWTLNGGLFSDLEKDLQILNNIAI